MCNWIPQQHWTRSFPVMPTSRIPAMPWRALIVSEESWEHTQPPELCTDPVILRLPIPPIWLSAFLSSVAMATAMTPSSAEHIAIYSASSNARRPIRVFRLSERLAMYLGPMFPITTSYRKLTCLSPLRGLGRSAPVAATSPPPPAGTSALRLRRGTPPASRRTRQHPVPRPWRSLTLRRVSRPQKKVFKEGFICF